MRFESAVKIAQDYLGEKYFSNLKIAFEQSNDLNTLKVTRNNNEVLIQYGQLSQAFRSLALIKEKHNELKFEYLFNKKFNTSGVMVDCSRNGVLKNDKIKELILITALMGHDRFLIYTEDILKLEKYPYLGYLRGAYSKDDIKDFVAYGEAFGVELIPCVQTLGHLRQALKWLPMDELRDGPDTLLVDSPKVYEFIEDIIGFCRECFKSKEIHIGMDESLEMGLNRHLQIHGYQDRMEMLCRHLDKVKGICKKFGFSPMIWSDMLFRLNNKDGCYYQDSPLPEKTLKMFPKDVKLVYWDYYHNNKEDYLKQIRFHKQTNNPIVFAGGSWRWVGFAPSIEKSIEYTKKAIDACSEENVKDILITAWSDDGNESSFFSIIPVLAEASVMNYGEFDIDSIDSLTKAISEDNLSDFYKMDLPNLVLDKKVTPFYNPSKFLFYQDLLLGIFDSQVKEDFGERYKKHYLALEEMSKKSPRFAYIYQNLANLCDVLSIKANLGINLRKTYQNSDKKHLEKLVKDIDSLLEKVDSFCKSFEKQWMKECRPFGFEVMDGRFGVLKNRIYYAKNRILDYLNKKIEKIEELEEDILLFDGRSDEVSWNIWQRIISPSN